MMDEKLLRQLVRQMKFLNFFMAFFGILILAGMAVIGFMLWQMVTFAQNVNERVQNTTEQLDVRQQACESEQLGEFLRNNSNVCN